MSPQKSIWDDEEGFFGEALVVPVNKKAQEKKEPNVKKVKAEVVKPVAKITKVLGKVAVELAAIEARFLESAGITVDLSVYPVLEDHEGTHQVVTDKSKSDTHGEVFTPVWLVDKMLEKTADSFDWKDSDKATEDLCSGYGQFSIRMLRKKYTVLGERFYLKKFLEETHLFVEIQPDSCYRLLYAFGTGIRLLMGDAAKKGLLPDKAETGVWVWSDVCGTWKDLTVPVQKMFVKASGKDLAAKAKDFLEKFEAKKELIESRHGGK